MSTNVPLGELLDELPKVEVRLNQARKDYLDADAAYDKRGAALEKTVIAEVVKYRSPKANRAKVVKDRANSIEIDIQRFSTLRADLATELAIMLVQMQMKVKSFEAVLVTIPPGTRVDPKAAPKGDPLGQVRTFLKNADKKEAIQVLLATKATLIGMNVRDALVVATNLIVVRQGKLEAYLGKVLSVNVDKAIESLEDVLKGEMRAELIKQLLEYGVKLIGVAGDFVPPVKIVTITAELYLNLKKLKKERYGRANVDDMLDLSDQIRAETETFEKDLELFGVLGDAIGKEKAA